MTTGTDVVTTAEPEVTGRRGRPRLSEGARAERRLGWLLCAPAVIVMIAVAAFPILYAVWLSLQRYDLRFPQLAHFVGLSNYAAVLSSSYWWHALIVTADHHGGLGRHRVRPRHAARDADVPDHLRPGHGAHHHPDPLRDRDRGRRLWLAVRLDAAHRLPGRPQQRAADQPGQRDRDHHPGGDLEDHPVHGAAADGRVVARAGGPAEGGPGGRRQRLAALLPGHAAADEAGHPGGAAVPDAGRVPDLRQHLHPDRWRQRHLLRVDPGVRQPVPGAEPGHRVGDLHPDLHLRRDHRLHLHQALRRGGTGPTTAGR